MATLFRSPANNIIYMCVLIHTQTCVCAYGLRRRLGLLRLFALVLFVLGLAFSRFGSRISIDIVDVTFSLLRYKLKSFQSIEYCGNIYSNGNGNLGILSL